jgi:pilus assembly protein CpaC
MYDNQFAEARAARSRALISLASSALAVALMTFGARPATAQTTDSDSVIRKITGLSEKLELTTNSSRILTLDKNIPRVQVNNPELLAVTPLSATQVQISAKKAGVTQVNLWDDAGGIHTIDVQIYGDARELTAALQTQFPHSSIKVYRYSESLVLTGFVDRPDHVGPIMRMAEDYAPKVINNINVGGVQQILLKVKVMEISRTKLRQLGVDWAWFGGSGFAVNRAGGLISEFSSAGSIESLGDTFSFGIIGDTQSFFGVLNALQEHQVAKTLAEPNIVAVSGRPAQFHAGGEFPILIPQSLGTSSIEYKPYGTQVDFLPIVLGNGNIRLEVRPRISDIDPTLKVTINDTDIPALTTRQVDTAVEMKAGQTFALAGLVQERTESLNSGLPYLSDVPVFGVPFRKTRNKVNEIELLVIITPEFVDPMDGCEAPCDGPGYFTTNPTNKQLYGGGHVEVPVYLNPTSGLTACGQDPCDSCARNNGCNGCNNGGCNTCDNGQMPANAAPMPVMNGEVNLPGGTGYDDSANPPTIVPTPTDGQSPPEQAPANATPGPAALPTPPPPQQGVQNMPDDITLPMGTEEIGDMPTTNAVTSPVAPLPQQTPAEPAAAAPPVPLPGSSRTFQPAAPFQPTYSQPTAGQDGGMPQYTAPRPYSPQRQPVFMRNAIKPYNPQPQAGQPAAQQRENSLIGPVGYDVQ